MRWLDTIEEARLLLSAWTCLMDGPPDARGRRRHIEMGDAERAKGIKDRGNDGLRSADAPGLTGALTPSGLACVGTSRMTTSNRGRSVERGTA